MWKVDGVTQRQDCDLVWNLEAKESSISFLLGHVSQLQTLKTGSTRVLKALEFKCYLVNWSLLLNSIYI